jgi:predicted phosphodiesterase
MRKLLQKILKRPILWIANRFSSSPDKQDIFESLDCLLENILEGKQDSGVVIPFNLQDGKFIILSDHHKGGRDLADDFRLSEENYLAALDYYYKNGYTLINIGDCEELWENTPNTVLEKNRLALLEEAKFLQSGRYYRTFGNHDLEWKYLVPQTLFLRPIFGPKFKIYEGLVLQTTYNNATYSILLTHGHQGDKKSDGNPLSTWIVAAIWTPIQRFLEISINTIADSFELVDEHNIYMYQWSATKRNLLFISGHTHKPVFASLDHIDRLSKKLEEAIASDNQDRAKTIQNEIDRRKKEYAGKKIVQTMSIPSYFNTGCCCFSDGDITGIEICNGDIQLIKWEKEEENSDPARKVLERSELSYVFEKIKANEGM